MLRTELCCAPRSRRAYSVYRLQTGETPLSNHSGEGVHGRKNRKRENALKCKQALSHLFSLSLFHALSFYKQISDGKKYPFLKKTTKWPWKINAQKKKKDIQRISQHICENQTNSCVESDIFAYSVLCGGCWQDCRYSAAPSAADIVLGQPVYTDPILFTCVPHHLLSSAWPWERSRSFERSTFSLTCNKLSTAIKNTEAEPVVYLSCLLSL